MTRWGGWGIEKKTTTRENVSTLHLEIGSDWFRNCLRLRCGCCVYQQYNSTIPIRTTVRNTLSMICYSNIYIWMLVLKSTFHLHMLQRLNWTAQETGKRSFRGRTQRFPFVSVGGVNGKANSCTAQHQDCLFSWFPFSLCLRTMACQVLWRGVHSVNSSSEPFVRAIHRLMGWTFTTLASLQDLLWKHCWHFFKRLYSSSHESHK